MGVRDDCRHFIGRSTAGNERIEKCRLDVAVTEPEFACPDDCLFFEARKVSDAGWQIRHPGEGPDR